MARPVEWAVRIPEMREQLGAMEPGQPLGPVDVGRIFHVTKAAALRLVGQIGPDKAFEGSPVVTAAKTLEFLQFSAVGQAADKEAARRRRLGLGIKQADEERPLREMETRYKDKSKVAQVLRAGIREVPGCTITSPPREGVPGEIKISYLNNVDAIGKCQILMLAIINHEEEFYQMTTPLSANPPGRVCNNMMCALAGMHMPNCEAGRK